MHAMRFGCSRRKKEVMVREMWASASSQAGAWLGAVKVEGEAAQLEVVMLPRRHESIRVEGCKHGQRRAGQVDWVELWAVGAWSRKQQCRRRKRGMATGVIGIGGGWVQSSQASKYVLHATTGRSTSTVLGVGPRIPVREERINRSWRWTTMQMQMQMRRRAALLGVTGGCSVSVVVATCCLPTGQKESGRHYVRCMRTLRRSKYGDTHNDRRSCGIPTWSHLFLRGEGMDSANTALEMKPQTAQESDTAQKEWKRESMATSGWKAAQHHESQGKPSSGGRSPGAKKTAGTTQWGT
ncbi:hypothetical protein B0H10DRAFT_1952668 [Mycena sp. CBHHK59/15]|nr:hypothetical protein B0H10DRAFT_1952668 [Mycena sp. CBHHK59/15]